LGVGFLIFIDLRSAKPLGLDLYSLGIGFSDDPPKLAAEAAFLYSQYLGLPQFRVLF
jgi:hypothetical protein